MPKKKKKIIAQPIGISNVKTFDLAGQGKKECRGYQVDVVVNGKKVSPLIDENYDYSVPKARHGNIYSIKYNFINDTYLVTYVFPTGACNIGMIHAYLFHKKICKKIARYYACNMV